MRSILCSLKTLFLSSSFCIINSISFIVKKLDGTFVQKLMEVHVDISKKLIRILCLIKNNKSFLKNKNFKKLKKERRKPPHGQFGVG
jgi:hypothetical protein